MNDPGKFAADLALETGDLLKDYFDKFGIRSTQKADQSVVTEADLAADRLIVQKIREFFPLDGIISEESSHFLVDPQSPPGSSIRWMAQRISAWGYRSGASRSHGWLKVIQHSESYISHSWMSCISLNADQAHILTTRKLRRVPQTQTIRCLFLVVVLAVSAYSTSTYPTSRGF